MQNQNQNQIPNPPPFVFRPFPGGRAPPARAGRGQVLVNAFAGVPARVNEQFRQARLAAEVAMLPGVAPEVPVAVVAPAPLAVPAAAAAAAPPPPGGPPPGPGGPPPPGGGLDGPRRGGGPGRVPRNAQPGAPRVGVPAAVKTVVIPGPVNAKDLEKMQATIARGLRIEIDRSEHSFDTASERHGRDGGVVKILSHRMHRIRALESLVKHRVELIVEISPSVPALYEGKNGRFHFMCAKETDPKRWPFNTPEELAAAYPQARIASVADWCRMAPADRDRTATCCLHTESECLNAGCPLVGREVVTARGRRPLQWSDCDFLGVDVAYHICAMNRALLYRAARSVVWLGRRQAPEEGFAPTLTANGTWEVLDNVDGDGAHCGHVLGEILNSGYNRLEGVVVDVEVKEHLFGVGIVKVQYVANPVGKHIHECTVMKLLLSTENLEVYEICGVFSIHRTCAWELDAFGRPGRQLDGGAVVSHELYHASCRFGSRFSASDFTTATARSQFEYALDGYENFGVKPNARTLDMLFTLAQEFAFTTAAGTVAVAESFGHTVPKSHLYLTQSRLALKWQKVLRFIQTFYAPRLMDVDRTEQGVVIVGGLVLAAIAVVYVLWRRKKLPLLTFERLHASVLEAVAKLPGLTDVGSRVRREMQGIYRNVKLGTQIPQAAKAALEERFGDQLATADPAEMQKVMVAAAAKFSEDNFACTPTPFTEVILRALVEEVFKHAMKRVFSQFMPPVVAAMLASTIFGWTEEWHNMHANLMGAGYNWSEGMVIAGFRGLMHGVFLGTGFVRGTAMHVLYNLIVQRLQMSFNHSCGPGPTAKRVNNVVYEDEDGFQFVFGDVAREFEQLLIVGNVCAKESGVAPLKVRHPDASGEAIIAQRPCQMTAGLYIVGGIMPTAEHCLRTRTEIVPYVGRQCGHNQLSAASRYYALPSFNRIVSEDGTVLSDEFTTELVAVWQALVRRPLYRRMFAAVSKRSRSMQLCDTIEFAAHLEGEKRRSFLENLEKGVISTKYYAFMMKADQKEFCADKPFRPLFHQTPNSLAVTGPVCYAIEKCIYDALETFFFKWKGHVDDIAFWYTNALNWLVEHRAGRRLVAIEIDVSSADAAVRPPARVATNALKAATSMYPSPSARTQLAAGVLTPRPPVYRHNPQVPFATLYTLSQHMTIAVKSRAKGQNIVLPPGVIATGKSDTNLDHTIAEATAGADVLICIAKAHGSRTRLHGGEHSEVFGDAADTLDVFMAQTGDDNLTLAALPDDFPLEEIEGAWNARGYPVKLVWRELKDPRVSMCSCFFYPAVIDGMPVLVPFAKLGRWLRRASTLQARVSRRQVRNTLAGTAQGFLALASWLPPVRVWGNAVLAYTGAAEKTLLPYFELLEPTRQIEESPMIEMFICQLYGWDTATYSELLQLLAAWQPGKMVQSPILDQMLRVEE